VAAIAAVAATLALPGSASASAAGAFHTPGFVSQCFVPIGHDSPADTLGLVCWDRRSGRTWSMGPTTRAVVDRTPGFRGYRDPFSAHRMLPFGRHWAYRVGRREIYHCVSRPTSLLCWNEVGQGWRLDRDGDFATF
jgi:hypothetical protein